MANLLSSGQRNAGTYVSAFSPRLARDTVFSATLGLDQADIDDPAFTITFAITDEVGTLIASGEWTGGPPQTTKPGVVAAAPSFTQRLAVDDRALQAAVTISKRARISVDVSVL